MTDEIKPLDYIVSCLPVPVIGERKLKNILDLYDNPTRTGMQFFYFTRAFAYAQIPLVALAVYEWYNVLEQLL